MKVEQRPLFRELMCDPGRLLPHSSLLVELTEAKVGVTERTLQLDVDMAPAGIVAAEYAECPCFILWRTEAKPTGCLSLGRSSTNDLVVDRQSISGHHATLEQCGDGACFATDENSRNSTFVDGKRLEPSVRVPLLPGSRISFGAAEFLFVDSKTLRRLIAPSP